MTTARKQHHYPESASWELSIPAPSLLSMYTFENLGVTTQPTLSTNKGEATRAPVPLSWVFFGASWNFLGSKPRRDSSRDSPVHRKIARRNTSSGVQTESSEPSALSP